jgi:hypothetical protein
MVIHGKQWLLWMIDGYSWLMGITMAITLTEVQARGYY